MPGKRPPYTPDYSFRILNDAVTPRTIRGEFWKSNPLAASYAIPHLLLFGKVEEAAIAFKHVFPVRPMAKSSSASRRQIRSVAERLVRHEDKIKKIISTWRSRSDVFEKVHEISDHFCSMSLFKRGLLRRPIPPVRSRDLRVIIRRADRWIEVPIDSDRLSGQRRHLMGSLNSHLNACYGDPRLRKGVLALKDLMRMVPIDDAALAHATLRYHSEVRLK